MLDSEKREIIKRLLRLYSAMSDKRIAWIVGCDVKVISQIRRELLDSGGLDRHEVDNAHNAQNMGVG